MKVARLIDFKKFEFSNSDIVEPNVGECLLKVKVVSVCGTDIRREFNYIRFIFNIKNKNRRRINK